MMKQMTSQTALDAYVDEIHVTLTMLENMPSGARACDPARDWFEENFPNGGERAQIWDACPNWRWQVWFAVHSATTEEAVAFAQSCADRAAFYAKYAVAVAAKAAHAAAAYAAAHAAAAHAARAAAYADDAYAAYEAAAARAAAEAADAAAEAAAVARAAAYAYAADAAAAAAVDDEIQAQVAWARGILFS